MSIFLFFIAYCFGRLYESCYICCIYNWEDKKWPHFESGGSGEATRGASREQKWKIKVNPQYKVEEIKCCFEDIRQGGGGTTEECYFVWTDPKRISVATQQANRRCSGIGIWTQKTSCERIQSDWESDIRQTQTCESKLLFYYGHWSH